MRIYNTLSRTIEEFEPINPPNVGMYSCGPTVYDYQQIGNMRRYVGDDLLIRVLKFNNLKVHQVMNITDVGHLTSDADTGEDKMEKGSKKFGLSVWEIAKKFEKQFKDSCDALNIALPKELMHATDYIDDQIELIKTLEQKGFTYKTTDGIYFDTSKFPNYFKLSRQNPSELRPGIRVDLGEKKNITDFALWKFSPKEEKRQMEWDSPWGKGFPGWHIECSAMSMKALGPSFDIHTGGIDHINIHHTNEIAQSEAATGKAFVRYWVHFAFLTVEGTKMSKSLDNFYAVQDIKEKGFDPLSLRYLYLQTHYRQEMNFTWEALDASQTALNKIRKYYLEAKDKGQVELPSGFEDAINDDLNIPKALSILWENIEHLNKKSFTKMDEIFGLNLVNYKEEKVEIPEEISLLVNKREKFRKEGKFDEADKIRSEIEERGFIVEDNPKGVILVKRN